MDLSVVPDETINAALKDGCWLHIFRSGGGLRVVRLSRGDALAGYGEHPQIEEALAHAAEDLMAGHRQYSDVYGKLHEHFLTGTEEASCPADGVILLGGTIDAVAEDDVITVEILTYRDGDPLTLTGRAASFAAAVEAALTQQPQTTFAFPTPRSDTPTIGTIPGTQQPATPVALPYDRANRSRLVLVKFHDHVSQDGRRNMLNSIHDYVESGMPLVLDDADDQIKSITFDAMAAFPACTGGEVEAGIATLMENGMEVTHPLIAWLRYVASCLPMKE